ncbi:hypothetical protein D9M69_648170 [compost metagenome]
MAVLMNQVTAKTQAISRAARRCCAGASPAPPTLAEAVVSFDAASARDACGTSTWRGRPITRCKAAHTRHAPRQPTEVSSQADSGHPTVLENPANSVMPVMARRASWPCRRTTVANAAS